MKKADGSRLCRTKLDVAFFDKKSNILIFTSIFFTYIHSDPLDLKVPTCRGVPRILPGGMHIFG
jgi:hypothetical protein